MYDTYWRTDIKIHTDKAFPYPLLWEHSAGRFFYFQKWWALLLGEGGRSGDRGGPEGCICKSNLKRNLLLTKYVQPMRNIPHFGFWGFCAGISCLYISWKKFQIPSKHILFNNYLYFSAGRIHLYLWSRTIKQEKSGKTFINPFYIFTTC